MADLSITAANVDHYSGNAVTTAKLAVVSSAGDVVFIDSDGEIHFTDASIDDAPGLNEKYGILVSAGGQIGQIGAFLSREGDVVDFGNDILVKGKWYGASSNAGKIRLINEVTSSVNEVQQITVTSATTGNFTLSFDGQGPTANIAHDATAATVKSALEALSNIDLVAATGGPLGSAAVDIEFQGDNAATNVPQMTFTDNTDGTVAVSTTTQGVQGDKSIVLGIAETTRRLRLVPHRAGIQA